MPYERVLDVIGRIEGTNKSDYGFLEAYEPVFAPLRGESFNLLEIGVYQGASLRTWRTYFPNAQIVGLDIEPSCRRYAGERMQIEIGSQADGDVLDRIVARYSPLIVIDDGSHLADHIIFSFERIFPGMPAGGLYVVEDAYMHFGPEEQVHIGLSKIRLSEYFIGLASMLTSKIKPPDGSDATTSYLFDHLDSVAFANGTIIIRKRLAPLESAQKIAIAEAFVSESTNPDHQLGLVRAVVGFGASPERSEKIIRAQVEKQGPSPEMLFRLAEILERQNRLVEAIESLEAAVVLNDGWNLIVGRIHVLARLAWLNLRTGNHEQSAHHAYQLVESYPNYGEGHRLLGQALEQLGQLPEAIEQTRRASELSTNERQAAALSADIARMLAKVSSSRE